MLTHSQLVAAANTISDAAQEYPGDDWQSSRVVKAADELAQHVQWMYDSTPATLEWMHGCGIKAHRVDDDEFHFYSSMTFAIGACATSCTIFSIYAPTRGHVRRMCELFGIALAEENTRFPATQG